MFSQVLIVRILPSVSKWAQKESGPKEHQYTIEKEMETWYLFNRPLLADCSLHEESKLDLHYNNLWLQLQRWLSFCIDFCILIFIFSLGHTGRKEPLQNLWQVSGRGGWEKIVSLIHCWLDFHVATTDSTESQGRVSLTWETLHEPPKSVRKKAAVEC